jgi:hypothetical protein
MCPFVNQNSRSVRVFAPEQAPYGRGLVTWTIKWWEWALSLPIPSNPVLDCTGKHAHRNQNGPVWFLAGTIGDENKVAKRTCVMPSGKAIFFPVINYIRTYDLNLNSDSQLLNHVTKDIDDIVVRESLLDNYPVPIYRINSGLFYLRVKEQNRLDIPVGINRAACDGYWVFLRPLAKGPHEIYFHGSCSGGIRNATANYRLTVL